MRLVPCTEWHSPTVRMPASAVTQQLIAIGLAYWIRNASGQSSRMSAAIASSTGAVRSPRNTPPGPRVSPTG